MTDSTIRFIRRGQTVTLVNVPPTRTLLEVLREDLACTGTKEGCGEGDCGACTVVLGEANQGRVEYRAINSCIRLAHSVDGLALWTAEDLAADPLIEPVNASKSPAGAAPVPPDRPAGLHPVQQAMVECHGSQCGFCTPGFVMSLFGLYQNEVCEGRTVTREGAQAVLSGNLCRCTGYRPILDAAQAMAQLPPRRVNEAELLSKLELISATGRWDDAKNTENPAYAMPATLPALLALRAAQPKAQIVAGCTDVGLWVTKQHRTFEQVIDVTRVAELRQIVRAEGRLSIGAAVTLTDAFAALVADRPQLQSFASRFAGLPVRNSGTLGGNVANGSPIGDSMPLLIALNATVVLASVRGERELALEQLYTGYRQNVMAADELLAWIRVPLPAANPPGAGAEPTSVYKVSKRFEDDISAVCLAIRLQVQGGTITQASIGAGGVAATPARAVKTEAFLLGQPFTQATLRAAGDALAAEFEPISDMRASAAYRRTMLRNLPQRFWRESQRLANSSLESLTLEVMA
ncbi:MAG: xanthine dehydrogenase small subunit [Burkholderiaceae bacterium]|nr:xanthine dehydrogenase small subunit [Burkholderiaceae bacterium]